MLTALIGPVSNLLGKFIEDKDMKNKLAHEVATMAENHATELAKGQIEINKAEAQHKSIFVSGWRPFIGWTCGIVLWHVGICMCLLWQPVLLVFVWDCGAY
jgi:hypothetical protein